MLSVSAFLSSIFAVMPFQRTGSLFQCSEEPSPVVIVCLGDNKKKSHLFLNSYHLQSPSYVRDGNNFLTENLLNPERIKIRRNLFPRDTFGLGFFLGLRRDFQLGTLMFALLGTVTHSCLPLVNAPTPFSQCDIRLLCDIHYCSQNKAEREGEIAVE